MKSSLITLLFIAIIESSFGQRAGVYLSYGLHFNGLNGAKSSFASPGNYHFGLRYRFSETKRFYPMLSLGYGSETFHSVVMSNTSVRQYLSFLRMSADVRMRVGNKVTLFVGIAPRVVLRAEGFIRASSRVWFSSSSFEAALNSTEFNPAVQKFQIAPYLGLALNMGKKAQIDFFVEQDIQSIYKQEVEFKGNLQNFILPQAKRFNPTVFRACLAATFWIDKKS